MTALRRQIFRYNAEGRGPGEPVMTQRRLAELAGLNPATVTRHVKFPQVMKVSQLLLYAKVLGCSVADLVEDEA